MAKYSEYLYQAQAGKNDWWRYVLMIGLVWVLPGLVSYGIWSISNQVTGELSDTAAWIAIAVQRILPFLLFIILFPMLFDRPFRSLLNNLSHIKWTAFFGGLAISLVLFTARILILLILSREQGNMDSFWVAFSKLVDIGTFLSFVALENALTLLFRILFWGLFIFQALNRFMKVPFISIHLTALLLSYVPEVHLLPYELYIGLPLSLSSFSGFYFTTILFFIFFLSLLIRFEGNELTLAFVFGQLICLSLLRYPEEMFFLESDMIPSFLEYMRDKLGFILTSRYLILVLFLIYYFFVSRIYKLHPWQVLWMPVPPYQAPQAALIDEIGTAD